MPVYLHRAIVFLLISLTMMNAGTADELKDGEPATDDMDSILEEADELLEMLEGPPVDDSMEIKEIPTNWLFISTARGGTGYSSNFLKRHIAVSSNYAEMGFDAYMGWTGESFSFTSLLFVEATLYDFESGSLLNESETDPTDEIIGFLQLNGQVSRGPFDFGAELGTFYGSLIYDSSLTTSNFPAGARIEQFAPSIQVYVDWFQSNSNRFRAGMGTSRAEFNISDQNYWDPSASLEWEKAWSTSLKLLSNLKISQQVYDEEVARKANGSPMPSLEPLKVDRLSIEERLTWEPKEWEWLKLGVNTGIAWEEEKAGDYEALRQSWIGGTIQIKNNWGRFIFRGRWGEYRYKYRTISDNSTLDLQTLRSLTVEYKRTLRWNLSLILKARWNSHSYRIPDIPNLDPIELGDDSYSERRVQASLEWSY